MRSFAVLAALLHVALASGHVAVRLPYLNPAGVTYVANEHGHGAPLVGAPGPNLEYQSSGLQYAQHHQALEYAQQQESGLHYAPQQPHHHHHHELQYAAHAPAQIEAHHVGYATAQLPAVAAVPVVKHVPAVADVPVTHIEAQHGFIEKQVDVAKPAVATRKFQVRRPAIQKHFYDIEERVIVRPAGTALVELDEPISKVQKGPTVVKSFDESHREQHHHLENHGETIHVTPSPIYAQEEHREHLHVTPVPVIVSSPTPVPVVVSSTFAPHQETADSVIVENPNLRNAIDNSLRQKERQIEDLRHRQVVLQAELQAERAAQVHSGYAAGHGIVTHSNGAPLHQEQHSVRLAAHDPSPAVVASVKSSSEQAKSNQHKLISLLTARGGVAEVGFGRAGPASHVGDAGHVRARVLSATPAPEYSEPTGERVSTRRVVVSRPIETLQEFDVVEPATKVERVSYQQPTLIKTARTHRVQVPTSVPVYGKALAPAVAHAAVPVYQKTISHAPQYGYYH
ncbi:uncharacterized protein LOC105691741 [Athalia rosae]|uniref:uncharacterized protein LOC105691741 n=1 Tax=Athalia rosae TaxID=37344 RepID=UPI002034908A|nr:uncharacterized protein LOC105691741 [Athalia rosae]